MKLKKLIIKTNTEKYSILIGSNLIDKFTTIVKKNSINLNKCLLVVDKNVPRKQILNLKKNLRSKEVYIYFIKASEKNKNQNTVNNILTILLKKNFHRKDSLISIGGGIVGDISGFAASLFKRGIQFINIPTTLLSQVDSSIGGKTGVNTIFGKNLIGTFYQPKIVISDTKFLKTLPKREIICGYGEILKHSLIANKNFYRFLVYNISDILNLKSPLIEKTIFESCKIKKRIVQLDETEKNLRKILNFGHTFAHAYEATLGYSKRLNHGEAVLLGMGSALKFSYENKFLNKKEYFDILRHIQNANLPYNLKKYFSTKHLNKIISFMLKDKKNNSKNINLILLRKIGNPILNKIYSKKNITSFLKRNLTY